MITTSEIINIHKTLRHGVATSYTANKVSLFITHDNIQKRFDATEVINSTTTSSGIVKFTGIPLWGDGSYSFYITAENNADLDVSGVDLERIGTGYIIKITNSNTLNI